MATLALWLAMEHWSPEPMTRPALRLSEHWAQWMARPALRLPEHWTQWMALLAMLPQLPAPWRTIQPRIDRICWQRLPVVPALIRAQVWSSVAPPASPEDFPEPA